MILQLRWCSRALFTPQLIGARFRAWHNVSQTTTLLRNSRRHNLPPIRWQNTGRNPALEDKAKVKFRKQDVKRLFRFARGEGYVILGENRRLSFSLSKSFTEL